jgi:hypothetical protein
MSTRDVPQQIPSLFDVPLAAPVPDVLEPSWSEKGPDKLAKDFVRWCFSFGDHFRNSPDITNLRYWGKQSKSTIGESEEHHILTIARPLFFKRIDQLTRKAEPSN